MRKGWLVVVIILVLVTFGLVYFWLADNAIAPNQPRLEENSAPEEAAEAKPPFVDLQPVLDAWAAGQSGQASVVVYDLDNDQLAGELKSDEVYFAASIYKLFVAYEGYRKVAAGTYDFDSAFLGQKTVKQCLDEMIRTSDSPCAETMWADLGKEWLTTALSGYGLKNTNMVALRTSAADVAMILRRIWQSEGLTEQHRQALLQSMKEQIYKDALPNAFSDDVTVYTKVGFSEFRDYHDTTIITLPWEDGERAYVVAVMTRGIGTANIRNLAQRLETTLKN